MEQIVEIKKPDPNPRDMAAGEIVVNVQKTDENGVTIKLWPDVNAVRAHLEERGAQPHERPCQPGAL